VIELKAYQMEEFKKVTLGVLKYPLAEYITTGVYQSSTNPNIRDCVRISNKHRTGCLKDFEGCKTMIDLEDDKE